MANHFDAHDRGANRRDFLRHSGALTAGLAAGGTIHHAAYAGEDNTIRLGLVGCGGRGTGAARQALAADRNTKLVALGDAFADKVETSYKGLVRTDVADRVQVDPDHRFAGFDAYKKVIEACDLVMLATPPHFRPLHLKAAIDAGRHVFAEKPVAVDAPGVRSVLESAEKAKQKNLGVLSGLCWRYETHTREMIERLHDGAIGSILAAQALRMTGTVWVRRRQPDQTDMQYQMRNWYYFPWLSGDFCVEQFVHELDRVTWALGGEYPSAVLATGGRLTRDGQHHGCIYDHFAGFFEYEDGTRFDASTRQQGDCDNAFRVELIGEKGRCDMQRFRITGPNAWRHKGGRTDMHQLEHNHFFEALRNGRIINNGGYMAKSTLMGLMLRDSAYTGKRITWNQMLQSERRRAPDRYTFDAPPPEVEVPMPGKTKFK